MRRLSRLGDTRLLHVSILDHYCPIVFYLAEERTADCLVYWYLVIIDYLFLKHIHYKHN